MTTCKNPKLSLVSSQAKPVSSLTEPLSSCSPQPLLETYKTGMLKGLYPGKTFANYKEICEFFGLPAKAKSADRTIQFDILTVFIEFTRIGSMYVVSKLSEPAEAEERVVALSDLLELRTLLFCQSLLEAKYGFICSQNTEQFALTKNQLIYMCGLTKGIIAYDSLDSRYVKQVKLSIRSVAEQNAQAILNQLDRWHLGLVSSSYLVWSSEGARLASDEERGIIWKQEAELLTAFNLTHKAHLHVVGKTGDFYKIMQGYIAPLGLSKYCKVYVVETNREVYTRRLLMLSQKVLAKAKYRSLLDRQVYFSEFFRKKLLEWWKAYELAEQLGELGGESLGMTPPEPNLFEIIDTLIAVDKAAGLIFED